MNALTVFPSPKRERKRPNRSEAKIVANARSIMELMTRDALNPKTTAVVRASIARAYAILGDAIRVWRGIPSPGQLRPDLDPVQLTKALKRARSRKPLLDIASHAFQHPDETPNPNDQPEPEPNPKESLSTRAPVTTPPTPGGG